MTDDLNAILLRGIEQAERGETIDRGDFTQHLPETVYVAFQMGGSNEGVIEGIHRTREAAEASFACGKKHDDDWDPKLDYRQTGAAGEEAWRAANCTYHTVQDWEVEGASPQLRAGVERDQLRAGIDAMWKRWFENAHVGLGFREAMEGIGGDLNALRTTWDNAPISHNGQANPKEQQA